MPEPTRYTPPQYQGQGYYQPYAAPGPQGPYQQHQPEPPTPVTGSMIFGLVMSILWLFGIGSFVGLIIGASEVRGARGGALVVNVLSIVFGAVGLFLVGLMILIANTNG